ncbi:MAG: ATP-binding protein [Pseudomonadota bacterium]
MYDLVDNSIDAARNELLKRSAPAVDERGLPSSYAGFHIDIELTGTSVLVRDNCSGMEREDLSYRAFRTGAKSQHPFGIGHFGVGLKRAIFKLGTAVSLETDNGVDNFDFEFTEQAVLAAGDEPLLAERRPSSRKKGNALRIGGLRSDVAVDFDSSIWMERLADGLRIRYGIFTRKGLSISLNGKRIPMFGPAVRDRDVGPVKYATQIMRTEKGVRIFAEAGLHEDYRIKDLEADYDKNRHVEISKEQGWYVVCNDRIILVADRTTRTGWTTGWHQEYAGFLGWVHYVAADPELLPWDSKKSGINESSEAHRESVAWLKAIADDFRAQKNKLRDRGGRQRVDHRGAASSRESSTPLRQIDARPVGRSPSASLPSAAVLTHTETHSTLFHACEIKTTSPKVRSLADEAARLEIKDFPYGAALLLRAFFEIVLIDYLKRKGRYGEVKQSVFDRQADQGRGFTDAQKKNFVPTLDNILEWVLKNEDAFPEHERRTCRRGCENFRGHVKRINGIVHEDGVLTGAAQVGEFRNDVLPTLRVLLEH